METWFWLRIVVKSKKLQKKRNKSKSISSLPFNNSGAVPKNCCRCHSSSHLGSRPMTTTNVQHGQRRVRREATVCRSKEKLTEGMWSLSRHCMKEELSGSVYVPSCETSCAGVSSEGAPNKGRSRTGWLHYWILSNFPRKNEIFSTYSKQLKGREPPNSFFETSIT